MIDIFVDEFACFIDDEQQIGVKTENIKETQTFVDLVWSRNKRISCVDWFPTDNSVTQTYIYISVQRTYMTHTHTDIVAVSCCSNMTFDDRVNIMNKSRVSTILLWNLSDVLLKAQVGVIRIHICAFLLCLYIYIYMYDWCHVIWYKIVIKKS